MTEKQNPNRVIRRAKIAGWTTAAVASVTTVGLVVGVSSTATEAATTNHDHHNDDDTDDRDVHVGQFQFERHGEYVGRDRQRPSQQQLPGREQRVMSATFTTRAWSCTMRLVVDDPRALKPAAADLVALLDRVDTVASRFRADSPLSIANARAGRPTPVPRLLVDLVEAALQAAVQTDGAVDPTLGRALSDLGYDCDIADLPINAPAVTSTTPRRSWRDVQLDRGAGLLTVPHGAALDLGATAKAYVADHAAHALHARYGTAVMVELGGDIAVAGHRPDGWCITVAEREGEAGQLLLLRHGGLVTSTTTVRRWRRGGTELHHILDPRTGCSTDGPWRTVTVAAPRALAANVASTAAIVLGDDALGWLTVRGIAARLVHRDGNITTTAGWPTARTPELAS